MHIYSLEQLNCQGLLPRFYKHKPALRACNLLLYLIAPMSVFCHPTTHITCLLMVPFLFYRITIAMEGLQLPVIMRISSTIRQQQPRCSTRLQNHTTSQVGYWESWLGSLDGIKPLKVYTSGFQTVAQFGKAWYYNIVKLLAFGA